MVFSIWTLNIPRNLRIGLSRVGYGWRQSLVGFDWLWRRGRNKVGDTGSHGSGDENGWNSKTQADHRSFRARVWPPGGLSRVFIAAKH
jgi:hypothetical protein